MTEENFQPIKSAKAQLDQSQHIEDAKVNDIQETAQANIAMEELFYGENNELLAESPLNPSTEINVAETYRNQS